MLDRAREAGHITGGVPHLIPGGVSQLQYADDTMLMFAPDDKTIASVKLILLCFEMMSGLKINFQKCEVVAMGMANREGQRVANLLNCRLGAFPIQFLGF